MYLDLLRRNRAPVANALFLPDGRLPVRRFLRWAQHKRPGRGGPQSSEKPGGGRLPPATDRAHGYPHDLKGCRRSL